MKLYAKFIAAALLAFAFAACSSDRTDDIELSLIPYQDAESSLWGFIDQEGNIKIPAKFAGEPGFFKNGYALIRTDSGRYDFVDQNGKTQGKRYINATGFSESYACVVNENSAPEYIDKNMNAAFVMKNALSAGMFSEGLARYRDKNGFWGFVNTSGKVVIKPKYNSVSPFKDGISYVYGKGADGKMVKAIIDQSGDIIRKFENTRTAFRGLNEGLAAFNKGEGWGYLNENGEVKIPENKKWSDAQPFYNGIACVLYGSVWRLIDKEGKYISDSTFKTPLVFFKGLASINVDGKFGFINTKGEMVIPAEYDDIAMPFIGKTAIVKKDGAYIFIGQDGKAINENKVQYVSKNYYKINNKDYMVNSDFFDVEALTKEFLSSLKTGECNGITKNTSSAQAMKMFDITDKGVHSNPYDTSLVISKREDLKDGINITKNIKFKAVNGKSRIVSIVYRMQFPNKFFSKLPSLLEKLNKTFEEAGFKTSGRNKQFYMDSPDSWATVYIRALRVGMEFKFKYE